jgi:hypothetical protein
LLTIKSLKKNLLKLNIWASNKNIYVNLEVYKAKICTITLLGDISKERVKFIRDTLPKNKNFYKIENTLLRKTIKLLLILIVWRK